MNLFRLVFAIAYAILLLGAAFYYCAPNIAMQKRLENSEKRVFDRLEKSMNILNISTLAAIKKNVFDRPHHISTENKALRFKNTTFIAKQKIADLQVRLAENSDLNQQEKDAAVSAYKTVLDSLKINLEAKEWVYWKDKVLQIDKIQPLLNSPALYLKAIQTSIFLVEVQFSNYALDRFTAFCGYSPDEAITTFLQCDNMHLKEGERLKGWLGFAKLDIVNSRDTIFINGKPQVLNRAMLIYKHAPQPAGRYPLIVTGNLKHFKNIPFGGAYNLRDTLYYTVR
jgi:hypothetical protein